MRCFYVAVAAVGLFLVGSLAFGRVFRQTTICDANGCRVVDVPAQSVQGVQAEHFQPAANMPTGVKSSNLAGDYVTVGGVQVNGIQAVSDASKFKLPADTWKGHVVIVGTKAFHEQAKAKIASSPLADKFQVHTWEGTEWLFDGGAKYPAGVTVCSPIREDKTVEPLHHQPDVAGLETAMEQACGILRRPTPILDMLKIPNLNNPLSSLMSMDELMQLVSGLGLSALLTLRGISIWRS